MTDMKTQEANISPKEIPSPGGYPELAPAVSPSRIVQPPNLPEIRPGEEPLTKPATAPPEGPSSEKFGQSLLNVL